MVIPTPRSPGAAFIASASFGLGVLLHPEASARLARAPFARAHCEGGAAPSVCLGPSKSEFVYGVGRYRSQILESYTPCDGHFESVIQINEDDLLRLVRNEETSRCKGSRRH